MELPISEHEEQLVLKQETEDTDHLQDYVGKEEDFSDQQLCGQERNSSSGQEEPEPLQIKEEQKEPEHPWKKEETMELPIGRESITAFLPFKPGALLRNSTIDAGRAYKSSKKKEVFFQANMEEFDREELSEGSDFEECVGFDDGIDENDDFESAEPIDRDLWLRHMFEDDEPDASDDEFEGFDSDWKTENYHRNARSVFNRTPGVKVDLPADATPLQAFEHIFNEELWMHLVTETNRYSDQTNQTPTRAKMAKWSPVTVTEMKTFIGLCMGMGLLVLPVGRDYWRQSKPLFRTQFPQNMSRDRFVAIWRYLHLQNNQAADVNKDDKLWKMRWFLNYLLDRFQALYEVDGNVSVDESMIKFKGRLSFRQYLPMKLNKWGVKVWVMAESSTGYVTNFQVYAGREGSIEKGLAHRVVMELARPYYGSYLSIYMDNFYTGVTLFEEMKTHGLNACGTVRANRTGLPKNERLRKNTSMEKHEFRVAQKDDLTFCIWQDTKTVMVLSNHHDPTQTGTVNRKKDGVNHVPVEVPASLADYQKHMKGVDLLDQMIGYYGFQHRSKKWWRRVFFFFLAMSCHNVYIAARSVGGTAFRHKYRGYKPWLEDLAEQLITPHRTRAVNVTPPSSLPASPSPSLPPSPAPSAGSRVDTPPPQHDFGKVYDKRKQCRECLLVSDTEKVGGPTVYGCKQCSLPLHIECFGKHYRRYM